MKAALSALLASRLPFPGLAAWAARSSDRTVEHASYVNWLEPTKTVQSFNYLFLAAETVQLHKIEPSRLSWSFEHVNVHLVMRPDGESLALFLTKAPELRREDVESILAEFLNA